MKRFSGSPIARQQVFVLGDGAYVVQWDDKRVQELLSGNYREYEHLRDFGHVINDYELAQLKAAGRVEHFNKKYVWLYALPEVGRYGSRKTMDRGNRVRGYYLSTALARTELERVRAALQLIQRENDFKVTSRSNVLVLLDASGAPYRSVQEAENALASIATSELEIFGSLSVGFVEVSVKEHQQQSRPEVVTEEDTNLDELIASQGDISTTSGRKVVFAVTREEEEQAISALFDNMKLDYEVARSGSDAIELLEDHHPDLFIMDLVMPDMHGWQILSKIKEIEDLRNIPVMIVTDETQLSMTTVARVDYISRPVSISRLRLLIWKLLRDRAANGAQNASQNGAQSLSSTIQDTRHPTG